MASEHPAAAPVAGALLTFPNATPPLDRGLLVTADQALVRAFRRELRVCLGPLATFDVQPAIDDARPASGEDYQWVIVDLDGVRAPADAVRLARTAWPGVRLAVLSHFWSERDSIARELADLVIHKPPRAQELRALIRPPAPAPAGDTPRTATGA